MMDRETGNLNLVVFSQNNSKAVSTLDKNVSACYANSSLHYELVEDLRQYH